jgi:hypothetical protein
MWYNPVEEKKGGIERKMAELEYSKYIISDPKPLSPELEEKLRVEKAKSKSTVKLTRLMSADDEIVKDFFYVDCNWLWGGSAEGPTEEPHTHEFDEVIGFIGSNRDDYRDLGGKISIWLDGKEEVLTQTCLIFVPAGVQHCPILFHRIDKPIFFVTIAPVGKYTRQTVDSQSVPRDASKPKYTIITEVKKDFSVAASSGKAPPPKSTAKGQRILHLEDDIAEGSFYVDFVWIYEGVGQAPAPEHTHDWPELIAMAGCDPEHPHDLGGPMSVVLGDEDHIITKSSLVCIPKDLKHCPWKFLDIKKPTLVFTAGPSGMYTGSHKNK